MIPGKITTVAQQVLDAVVAHYAGESIDLPARQYWCEGSLPAWDCEQVVVAVERMVPHNGDMTVEATRPITEVLLQTVELSVWVVRCVPVVTNKGNPPAAADIQAAAVPILEDPIHVVNALVAANKAGSIGGRRAMAVRRWDAVGPQGGLSGGRLLVRVDLTSAGPAPGS